MSLGCLELASVRHALGVHTLNVKDFGAVGDGVTDDTAAFQAAFDAVEMLDNTSGPSAGSVEEIFVPHGCYIVRLLDLPPGLRFRGAGREATKLIAPSGYAGVMIQMKRPDEITSGRTRQYSVSDMSIFGSRTAGCVGVNLFQVAEVELERVNVTGCDKGVTAYDVVTGRISRCIIRDNLTHGVLLRDGCNGIQFDNTRLRTTADGPNFEVDGGVPGAGFPTTLETLGVLLNNCAIEAALHPVNGIGALVGATNAAVNVVFNGCYFEANEAVALRIGSPTATGVSYVSVTGGNFAAAGKPAAKGIEAFGAFLLVNNPWLEGISTAANRLIIEASSGNPSPRLWNGTGITPSGGQADRAVGRGFGMGPSGLFQTDGMDFCDSPTSFGRFLRRPNDVAFQGNGKYLWVQTELRTSGQGTALLSAGVFDVVFPAPVANASYAVTLGSEGNNHLKISNKTIYGFRISAVDPVGNVQIGDTSRVHWHVFRNQ